MHIAWSGRVASSAAMFTNSRTWTQQGRTRCAMLQRRDIDSVGSDEAVIATNDDASSCKRCAVTLGYWRDRYINYFVRSTDRKAPEINRGYFARCVAIKMIVDKFIEVGYWNVECNDEILGV